MNAKDLAIIAVRIFALWTLLSSLLLLEQVPIAFFNPLSSSDVFTRYHSFMNAFNAVFYLSLGVILLRKTDTCAEFLARGTTRDDTPGASPSELAILGFGLIGMVVLIDGAGKIIQQSVVHFTKPEIDMGVQVIRQEVKWQILAVGITKVCLGTLLLFSPAGIARLLRWTRDAGKERQINP